MARMKQVFELKQELVELDKSYENLPDSYFIDLFIQIEQGRRMVDSDEQAAKSLKDRLLSKLKKCTDES